MIGYHLQHKNDFAEKASYVFQQIAKMIGLDFIYIDEISDIPESIDGLIIYGPAVPKKSELPTIYIAQSDYIQVAALSHQDIGTLMPKHKKFVQPARYLLSKEIPHLPTLLFVDQQTGQVLLSIDNQRAHCAVDIVATIFYCLSLENERRATDRDHFHRFQRDYSPMGEEFYDYPLVDRYAAMLRQLLKMLIPNHAFKSIWPDKKEFAVALSHDVDRIPTWTVRKSKRALRAAHSPYKNPISRWFRLAQSLTFPENWLGNFNFISRLEQQYDAASTFFFVSQHRHELDPTYKLTSPIIRQGIETLQKRNCDIGLHGSIPSATTNGFLELEKEDIEFFINDDVNGGRQHYLCFTEETLQYWQNARLKYDSTLGFSQHTGYRCGTSFPFQLHNGKAKLPIMEIPLILMDTVLFLESKQFLSARDAWVIIEQTLQETKQNNGLLTINWHNSDLHAYDVYGYSQLYISILKWTQQNSGWLASPDQVYEWWQSK
jgi:hypothetical protein